jgi:hypothetical protein
MDKETPRPNIALAGLMVACFVFWCALIGVLTLWIY